MNFTKGFLASLLGSLASFILIFSFFLIIISGLTTLVNSEQKTSLIEKNSVLFLDLNKPIIDRAPAYAEFESILGIEQKALGLNSIISAIKKASEDDRIKGIELRSGFIMAGWAQTRSIREELNDFKQTGKFIYAYADALSQKGYYIASIADSIGLNPEGIIDFKGLSSEVLYYKDFQEKYGIKMEVIRHGKYKSAVEPYLKNKMSDNNRKQIKELLVSIWSTVKQEISISRNLSINKIDEIAEQLKANTPNKALESGLIDLVIYEDEIESLINKSMNIDENKKINRISLKKMNASKISYDKNLKDRIAVIFARGTILYGEGGESIIAQGVFVDAIKEAAEDDWIKSIVLRIDSPGGSSITSDILLRAIKQAKLKKPIIVSMGNVAASGGYYIACAANKIYADPLTITGSIGVFAALPNISEFSKKIGINSEHVSTHRNSIGYSIYEPLQPGFVKTTKENIEKVYETFKKHVSEGRNMTIEEVELIAQGRVWSGIEALEIGLIDELGGLDQAIEEAANLAEIKKYNIIEYPLRKASLENFIQEMVPSIKIEENIKNNFPYLLKKIFDNNSLNGIQVQLPFEINIY
jgi:protease-4